MTLEDYLITNVEVQYKQGGSIEILFDFTSLKTFFNSIKFSDTGTKDIKVGTKFIDVKDNAEFEVVDMSYNISQDMNKNGDYLYNTFLTIWVEKT
jgi:hypothetical protein